MRLLSSPNNLILFLVLVGCSAEKQTETTDNPQMIDVESVSISDTLISPRDLMEDVQYIRLSSSDTFFIAQARKIVEFDNRFFILDNKKEEVVAYTNTGKFISRVGTKGEGPGEYASATDFIIDLKRKVIVIFSRGDLSILEYRSDLTFLRKIRLDLWAFQMSQLESGHLAFYTSFINEGLSNNIVIYNLEGDEIGSKMPYPEGMYTPMNFTGFIQGNYYTYPLSSKIYRIEEERETDPVVFDIRFPNMYPESEKFNHHKFFGGGVQVPILNRFSVGHNEEELLFGYSYLVNNATITTLGVKLASNQLFCHRNMKHGAGSDSDIFVKLFFLNSHNLPQFSKSTGYYYMLTDVDAMSMHFYSDPSSAIKEISQIDPEFVKVTSEITDKEAPVIVKFKLKKSI